MSGLSDTSIVSVLKHQLKILTWTAPANLYIAAHLATTLNAEGTAAATSITTDADVPDGAKIVINPLGSTPETFYAGAVTGAGPYTVPLLDAPGGSSAALVNTHAATTPVKFDPANEVALAIEPTAGTYARVLHNAWNNPTQLADNTWQATNNTAIDFALASDAAWGIATHFIVYDASTAGTAQFIGELDVAFNVILNARLRFPDATAKIKENRIYSA